MIDNGLLNSKLPVKLCFMVDEGLLLNVLQDTCVNELRESDMIVQNCIQAVAILRALATDEEQTRELLDLNAIATCTKLILAYEVSCHHSNTEFNA